MTADDRHCVSALDDDDDDDDDDDSGNDDDCDYDRQAHRVGRYG
jgi:hypothetical protein